MSRIYLSVLVAGALGAVAGCGGDDDGATTASRAATPPATTAPERPATAKFLLARGEQPGLEPGGSYDEMNTVAEFNAIDDNSAQGAARLRERGFVSFVAQRMSGKHGEAGVTNVAVFSKAAGAQADWAQQRRDVKGDYAGWRVKRFDVPGVRDSFGWTATRGDDRVGNVVWLEGRCVLTLGNAQAASFVGPLRTGVRAVHRRVAGSCP
jgi:hypothetical protein